MLSKSHPQGAVANRFIHVLPIAALALIGVVLWLPFGLHIGYFSDEWTSSAYVQTGNWLTSGSRPFAMAPWSLIYHIDPNSFVGVNLLMLLLIVGKSCIFYGIQDALDFDKLFAFGTATLALLYPADTGVFYIGAMPIQVSVFTFVLSIWLLLRFWNTNRFWWWILIWIVSAVCLGVYETVYPLFLIVPLLLVYKQKRITRRVVLVSLGWLVPLAVFGVRLVIIVLTQKSSITYQSSLLAKDLSFSTLVSGLWQAARYTLVDSWVGAFSQTFASTGWSGFRNILKTTMANPYLVYALMIVVITIVVMIALWKMNNTLKVRDYLFIVGIGVLLLLLGYTPYVVSTLRGNYLRTLLHASQGAALVVSGMIGLAGLALRRYKWVYTIVIAVIVLAASTSLLSQHRNYALLGQRQIPILQRLVQIAPHFTPNTIIVVVDDSPKHNLGEIFSGASAYLEASSQIIYDDPTLKGIICYPYDEKPWGYIVESCRFEADQITLSSFGQSDRHWHYNQVIVFHFDMDQGLRLEQDLTNYTESEQSRTLYHPQARIDTTASLPSRAYTMLGMPPK